MLAAPMIPILMCRSLSSRVVEDDAGGVAPPRAQAAHAVAELHAICAARAAYRPLVDREDHRVALRERHDLRARLYARALLGHDELAAGEVALRRRQENGELQRKDVLA